MPDPFRCRRHRDETSASRRRNVFCEKHLRKMPDAGGQPQPTVPAHESAQAIPSAPLNMLFNVLNIGIAP